MMQKIIIVEQRFWKKVVVRGPDDCWEWAACKNYKDGYGRMWVDGKLRCATHVLFYLRKRHWPSKERTCNHHCDNPGCLNPRHLYLGTKKSNARDKVQRGRCYTGDQKGEKHGMAKLTEKQVRKIKRLLEQGDMTGAEVSRMFGVSQECISNIKHGTRWRHVS